MLIISASTVLLNGLHPAEPTERGLNADGGKKKVSAVNENCICVTEVMKMRRLCVGEANCCRNNAPFPAK